MRVTTQQTLALLALLILVLSGCPQKKPPPPPPPTPEAQGPVVRAIDPSRVLEGQLADVVIVGDGFEDGATVRIGDHTCTGVEVQNEGRILATAPDLAMGTYDVEVENPDGGLGVMRRGYHVEIEEKVPDCQLDTVFFAFNEAALDESTRSDLKANANCIKERGLNSVRLEGHADERGSTEYNLALGQRRADGVRSFLINLGIDPGDLSTLSYGEERPSSSGSGEDAWAKNRRVEFNVR